MLNITLFSKAAGKVLHQTLRDNDTWCVVSNLQHMPSTWQREKGALCENLWYARCLSEYQRIWKPACGNFASVCISMSPCGWCVVHLEHQHWSLYPAIPNQNQKHFCWFLPSVFLKSFSESPKQHPVAQLEVLHSYKLRVKDSKCGLK